MKNIEIGSIGDGLQLKIIYSNRKTFAVELSRDGVLVRAPQRMKRCEIDDVLNENRLWIEENIAKMKAHEKVGDKPAPFTMDELRELADRALIVISARVKKYAPIVGVDYGRITIRNQRSRWGSCSSKGNLNFNCLLMLFSDEVIDYVVVHELCHRKHMDHSAAFYAEVERVLPEYRKHQKWLKENGNLYISRLP